MDSTILGTPPTKPPYHAGSNTPLASHASAPPSAAEASFTSPDYKPVSTNASAISQYEKQRAAIASKSSSSRTLPSLRRSSKKSFTTATRQKEYYRQTKVDGAYAILTEYKSQVVASVPAASGNVTSKLLSPKGRDRSRTLVDGQSDGGSDGRDRSSQPLKSIKQRINTILSESEGESDSDEHHSPSSCTSAASSSSATSSSSSSSCSSSPSEAENEAKRNRRKSDASATSSKRKRKASVIQKDAKKDLPLTFVMNRVGAIFGKAPGNDMGVSEGHLHTRRFTLNDPYISKQHFQIRFVHDRFYIWDTASSNGTYIRRAQHVTPQHFHVGTSPKHNDENCAPTRQRRASTVNTTAITADQYKHPNTWQFLRQPSPIVTANNAPTVQSNQLSHTHATSTVALPSAAFFNATAVEQSAYHMIRNRSIRIGSIELLVKDVVDASTDEDEDESSYRLVLAYALPTAPPPTSPSTSPPEVQYHTVTVTSCGAAIGKRSDMTIVLEDFTNNIASHHADISLIDGSFHLRPSTGHAALNTWLRLSPRSIESMPIALFDGDHVRAGSLEFSVNLRSVVSPITPYQQPRSVVDLGYAADANFQLQKEMQDRYLMIDSYAGVDKCIFLAVYDGHQERTVADFAAAALHYNLLEAIEVQLRQRASSLQPPSTHRQASIVISSPTDLTSNQTQTATAPAQPHLLTTPRGAARISQGGTMSAHANRVSPLIDADELTNDKPDRQSITSPTRLSFRSASLELDGRTSLRAYDSASTLSVDVDTDDARAEAIERTSAPATAAASVDGSYDDTDFLADTGAHASSGVTTTHHSPSKSADAQQPLITKPLPPFDMHSAIRTAYKRTAEMVCGMGEAAEYGGSTATICIIWHYPGDNKRVLYTANVGDSPAVLLRQPNQSPTTPDNTAVTASTPVRLTTSHIARDPSEQKRVAAAGGKITNNRLAGMLEVTRSFGDRGMHSFGLIAEPSISEHTLSSNDSYVIVSSDGVLDVVSDTDLATTVDAKPLPARSCFVLAQHFVDTALKKKTRDNCSIIVARLTGAVTARPPLPNTATRLSRAYTSSDGTGSDGAVVSGTDGEHEASAGERTTGQTPAAGKRVLPSALSVSGPATALASRRVSLTPTTAASRMPIHTGSAMAAAAAAIAKRDGEPDSAGSPRFPRSLTEPSESDLLSPVTSPQTQNRSPHYVESDPDTVQSPNDVTHRQRAFTSAGRPPFATKPPQHSHPSVVLQSPNIANIHHSEGRLKKSLDMFSSDDADLGRHLTSGSPLSAAVSVKRALANAGYSSTPTSPSTVNISTEELLNNTNFQLPRSADGYLHPPSSGTGAVTQPTQPASCDGHKGASSHATNSTVSRSLLHKPTDDAPNDAADAVKRLTLEDTEASRGQGT